FQSYCSGHRILSGGLLLSRLIVETPKELHVLPRRSLPLRVSQQCCRVIGSNYRETMPLLYLSPQFFHRLSGSEQRLCCGQTERKDEAGLHQLYLLVKIRNTGCDFFRFRTSISRRATL